MTQAFNLSQLANKVNSSGQLDATSGLSGATPIANGGTNNASLGVTAGGVVYTDGSKQENTGAGTTGQFLKSNGSSAPTWETPTGGFSNMQVFTSSGTFTVPAGITKAKVTVVGGGGGGGGANSGSYAGGGGAGGGAAIEIVTGLSGTVSVTVGSGGSGGNYGSGYGGTGGTSSFGAYCSATGGAGGKGGEASSTSIGSLGGIGSGGDMNIRGGAGMARVSATATGAGGNSILGGGGNGVQSAAGVAGGAYGGGGGGSSDNRIGAVGASGVVIVEY